MQLTRAPPPPFPIAAGALHSHASRLAQDERCVHAVSIQRPNHSGGRLGCLCDTHHPSPPPYSLCRRTPETHRRRCLSPGVSPGSASASTGGAPWWGWS
jgi:hypothetical protein